MIKYLILMTVLTFGFTGCASIQEKICEDYKPISAEMVEQIKKSARKQPLMMADISKVELKDVRFIVVTPENAQDKFIEMKEEKIDLALFSLTDNYYENLAFNMTDLLRMLRETQFQLQQYKAYYESDEQEKIEKSN